MIIRPDLQLDRRHAPVTRREVDALLPPERLSEEQKLRKVQNLMQELRRAGRIERVGSLEGAQWILGSGPEGFTRADPTTEA